MISLERSNRSSKRALSAVSRASWRRMVSSCAPAAAITARRRRRSRSTASAATSQIHQGALTSSVRDTTMGAVEGRLYHETAMSTSFATRAAHHVAGARLHRSAVVCARDGSRVRADVAGRGPRRSAGRAGAFIRRDVAGASVLIVRARGRIDPGVSQRLPPSRHAAVHRGSTARFRAASSARITRGPTGSTAACWRRRRWTRSTASIAPSIRCAGSRARRGTATSSSISPTRLRRWRRSSANCRQRFAPWAMQELRLAHRIEYDVATNWKLVVQNYNECLHCPVIHPLLNRMHHYLGAENVPSTEHLLRRRDGLQGGRRDAQHRRQAAARVPARPARARSRRW